MKNHLVVRFNLKKVLPEDIRLGSKVADRLDEVVAEKLKKAAERAKANKRTTILAQDL
jgi:histone H3/H4